jgi:hypothetical protein
MRLLRKELFVRCPGKAARWPVMIKYATIDGGKELDEYFAGQVVSYAPDNRNGTISWSVDFADGETKRLTLVESVEGVVNARRFGMSSAISGPLPSW